MVPITLAVATRPFGSPLRRALVPASRAGVRGVLIDVRRELPPDDLSDTGRRQFLKQLDELGLRVAALTLPLERPLPEPTHLEERLHAIRRGMEFAYQLKAPLLTLRIGRAPDDPESDDSRLLAELLNDLARHGNRVGATLAITPSSDDPQSLRRMLDTVTAGPVGVDFDPAAFVFAKHDPVAAVRTLHDRIAHVRLRDGIRDVDGSGLEVAVGRGEVDWTELLAVLTEAEFHGWATADRTGGEDRPGDVLRAIEYVRRVMLG